jgi:hypothetical protein
MIDTMSDKRHKQSSWSIWSSPIPRSSPAPVQHDVPRYCRVCLRDERGHHYDTKPEDSHPWDPTTIMRADAGGTAVEVESSVRAKSESDEMS